MLELHGALIAATVMRLEAVLARLLLRLEHPLVLDLTGIDRIDSTGAVLLTVAARAARPHNPVRLAAARPDVQTTLRTFGVLAEVPTYRSVDAAVRQDATNRITP